MCTELKTKDFGFFPLNFGCNDGRVDVLDLQQLGIHWGQRPADTGWLGAANLQLTTTTPGAQVINVLDLQVLGNHWGLRR